MRIYVFDYVLFVCAYMCERVSLWVEVIFCGERLTSELIKDHRHLQALSCWCPRAVSSATPPPAVLSVYTQYSIFEIIIKLL